MAENNEKSKAGFGLSEVDAPRPVWLERWEERSSQLELEQSVSEHTYLDTWLNYKSAHYARHAYQWDYISDHLHARVLDHERIREYILMREQGESDKAYKERLCLSSYTPDFYRATVALASMIFGNDNNVTRTFERDGTTALGNPMDTDKPFGQFWADVDGMGTDYEAFIFNLAVNLVAYGEMWILLDGWKQVEGSTMKIPPRLKLIPPQHVLRETHGPAGTINSAKVLTFTEAGEGTQRDKPKYRGVYTVYHDKNWERWTHDERGKEQELISLTNYGGDGGGFYYQGRTKQPTPPIFRVRLPIDAPIGYTMARKANTLLNHESTKDFLLHIACFSKFMADVYTSDKRFDPVHFDKIAAAFKAGSSIIPGAGGKFAAPSMEAAASKQAIIKSMREDFYTTFFQSYGDRAAQKTATESAQDFAQTTQAFLSMLATSINEAENEIMWRVEQAYEPARPNLWGSAHVAWTKNFASVQDPNERINSLVDRTMPGGKVPASVETMRSIITEWYGRHGFDVSDEGQQEELLELIRTAQDREGQQDSLLGGFGGG